LRESAGLENMTRKKIEVSQRNVVFFVVVVSNMLRLYTMASLQKRTNGCQKPLFKSVPKIEFSA